MSSLILHVEDEPGLTRLVEVVFRRLGFDGRVENAPSLSEAWATLQRMVAEGTPPSLILTDLGLPDGSGLDFIRRVRADPAVRTIPVVVLSGDATPDSVSQTYAVGANAFVSKIPPDGDIVGAVESLYACWMKAVSLPEQPAVDPARRILGRAVGFESRCARVYAELARRFRDTPRALQLWLDMALAEGNHANLLAFFEGMVRSSDTTPAELAFLEKQLARAEECLARVERRLEETPQPDLDTALGWALELEGCPGEELVISGLRILALRSPDAVETLVDSIARHAALFLSAVRSLTAAPDILERADALEAHFRSIRHRWRSGDPGAPRPIH